MKRTKLFEAIDGTTFNTATECMRHEENISFGLLRDLTMAEINEAMDRTNIPLADAFERIGNIIAARRRESGELKRRKPAGTATMDDIKKNMRDIS